MAPMAISWSKKHWIGDDDVDRFDPMVWREGDGDDDDGDYDYAPAA